MSLQLRPLPAHSQRAPGHRTAPGFLCLVVACLLLAPLALAQERVRPEFIPAAAARLLWPVPPSTLAPARRQLAALVRGSAWQQGSQTTAPQPRRGAGKHIFFIIPAYNVEYLRNVPPLTPHEKLLEMLRDVYDPMGLALGGVETLLEHSSTGFCGYGPGLGGFGKCYGAALVDANTSGFIGDYLLPVWFHQDPRYFRLGQGSGATRIFYALSRVFVTRSDRGGGTVVDSSALLGTLAAAVLSNVYYPRTDRGVGLTMSRIGFDLGGTAIFNLGAEFWPDIKNAL